MSNPDHISSSREPQRLAVKLNKAGEKSVKQGHPWVFSDSIVKINKDGQAGDIAIVFDSRTNKVIGVGLYDPASPIRIKMLHHGGPATIDPKFFEERIGSVYVRRETLFETDTNSYRLLFGENDGFPGFIADIYDKVLVVKLYSEIWFPYFEAILPILVSRAKCTTAVLRLSRLLQRSSNTPWTDGSVVHGDLPSEEVVFREHGVKFMAHVIKGHKTGYFLDHRHNRKRVGELSKGRHVLDVFSYAGGFSVHALAGGAASVTSVDISEQALELAVRNGKLNEHSGSHKTIVGDAFELLESLISEGTTFDIVVIDPPSFAKRQSEVEGAKRKYRELANLGAKLTAPDGWLVLASCSSRISSQTFFDLIERELSRSQGPWTLVETTGHDMDHPISFPEGAYLKCAYYRHN